MPVISLLNSFLHDKIPFLILLNFILFIVLIFFNWNYIKNFLLKIDKKTWLFLFLIFVIALLIRIFIPTHSHIMYIDEAWYMEAGKNMLETGSQDSYPKYIGWPFILTIVFSIFGINNWIALYTSILLGALTIVNIFLLSYIITKRKKISLIAALLFSLFPAHIRWSASAEANIASLFFISLTIFLCFLYYKKNKISLLWLAIVALAFTAQIRVENYIFPVLFLFGCVLFDKKNLKKINFKFILPWIVLLILSFPNLIQNLEYLSSENWQESESDGRLTGSNWSITNLVYNTIHYGKNIFMEYPFFITILFVIGLIYAIIKDGREAYFLITWFLFMYLIHFVSWPTNFESGGQERYYMSFYPIISIFASYGVLLIKNQLSSKIKNKIFKKLIIPITILIILLMFIPYVISTSKMYSDSSHILETKIPELAERDIPPNCIIIANLPTILKSTTNLNVINIRRFLESPQYQEEIFKNNSCILFFKDLTCQMWDFSSKDCKQIQEYFLMTNFKSYEEKDTKYIFYKIEKRK